MLRNQKLVLAIALALAAGGWFYIERVLIPYQEADAAAHGRPRGILSDLYPRWLGARELLLNHRDPYGPEVTREIQMGHYGHVLDPGRSEDPKDEQRFAYPVYVIFFLAPVVGLPFSLVQVTFTWVLGIVTALSVLLWLRAMRWRPSGTMLALLLLMTLSSFAAMQGIKLQQLSLLVGGLIATCVFCVVSGHLVLAGIFLGLATIKPQLALLLAVWMLLWALSRWRQRQALVWAFVLSMAALVGGGEYFLPGWVGRFLDGVVAYERYTGGGSLLDVLATRSVGTALTLLLVLGIGILCWRARHVTAESAVFGRLVALVLTVTVIVVPMTAPYNQVLLLPAVLLIIRGWEDLSQDRFSRAVCVFAAVIAFWPWLASFALMVASFVLPATTVQAAWAVPLWTSLAIPLVILPLAMSLLVRSMGGDMDDAADARGTKQTSLSG